MKTIKFIKMALCITLGCIIGYSLQPTKAATQEKIYINYPHPERPEVLTKDYVAACVLSDICRIALDHEDLDAGGFQDLYWDIVQNIDSYTDVITSEELHNNYVWFY